MEKKEFIQRIKATPNAIAFEKVMELIDAEYEYTPVRFTNGSGDNLIINETGENEGSCKIFAFGLINKLSERDVLACFGKYYQEVIKNPNGHDHQNIRNFMRFGWKGIMFEKDALKEKVPEELA